MTAQPQLLQIALDKKDIVYTPDWVARDMVDFFKPSGRILEPSAGDGAILKYLPGADWCEIEQGRDFFACQERYDWIVGNPPFRMFYEFMLHSFKVAENTVYLLPADKPFNVFSTVKMIYKHGGIVHARFYNDGRAIGVPEIHRPATAFHFQRNYTGPMYTSFYEAQR
jgi:hypothetical protein